MNPQKYPQRKSPRLKDYDYAQNGAYFVTICTQNRVNLFGQIAEAGEISYTPAGLMLFHWWDELANKYHFISLDAFVVMRIIFTLSLFFNQRVTTQGHPYTLLLLGIKP